MLSSLPQILTQDMLRNTSTYLEQWDTYSFLFFPLSQHLLGVPRCHVRWGMEPYGFSLPLPALVFSPWWSVKSLFFFFERQDFLRKQSWKSFSHSTAISKEVNDVGAIICSYSSWSFFSLPFGVSSSSRSKKKSRNFLKEAPITASHHKNYHDRLSVGRSWQIGTVRIIGS